MKSARLSIASRLTMWYATVAFTLVAAAVWVQYRALARDLSDEDDQLLRETSAAVSQSLALHVPTGSMRAVSYKDTLGEWASKTKAIEGPIFRLLDDECRVIDQRGHAPLPPPDCKDTPRAGPRLRTWHSADGREWRIASTPVSVPVAATLEVALDRSTDVGVLARFRRQLFVVLAMALLAAVGIGFAVARRGLSPLKLLAQRVSSISAQTLNQRVAVGDAPSEIQELSSSFDRMLAKLEAAFVGVSEYSAEIAHELRTPLHVLRQQIEVALGRARTVAEYKEVLASSLEELERLRRMTDDILFLARADNPRSTIRAETLCTADELKSVSDFMSAIADERGVTIVVASEEAPALIADRTLLRRAVVNLVTNALAHTPRGGEIRLSTFGDGSCVVVAVEDTGEGIPPDALPRVSDRYFRVPGRDSSRSDGVGLGLAIVAGIMRLHEGSIEVDSKVGHGTRVRLRFPALNGTG